MSTRRKPEAGDATTHALKGRPPRLSGQLPVTRAALSSDEVELTLHGAEGVRARVRRRGHEGSGSARLKIRLPRSTPPGTYRGEARVGDERFPVVAEVEPRPSLRIAPRALSLVAAPGAQIDVELTVTNVGNVPVALPESSSFCLFDWSGINPSFGAALAGSPPEGKQRIDVLMDELADYHGGFVKAVVKSGELAPDETRAVPIRLGLPERLVAGRTYSGTWILPGRSYGIAVEVAPNDKREKDKRSKG